MTERHRRGQVQANAGKPCDSAFEVSLSGRRTALPRHPGFCLPVSFTGGLYEVTERHATLGTRQQEGKPELGCGTERSKRLSEKTLPSASLFWLLQVDLRSGPSV